MEFNFDIRRYFKDEITRVESRLIPEGFTGDRREIQECITRMSLILTVLGENSAKAQGLQKVITSGERLRNTDHIVYIMIDADGGSRGNGSILGMLKMGVKHLYVFDAGGNHHEVSAMCVLDFYIHESKQRMGLGKKLFEFMLQDENVTPEHLAIDKPSPKFLSFLKKHYNLQTVIPQMNNFVVFDGFFSDRKSGGRKDSKDTIFAAGVSSHATRISSGFGKSGNPQQPAQNAITPTNNSIIGLDNSSSLRYGRSAACKPVSTMGLILQNKPLTNQPTLGASTGTEDTTENTGTDEAPPHVIIEVAESENRVNGDNEQNITTAEEEEDWKEDDIDGNVEDEIIQKLEDNLGMKQTNVTANSATHLDLKFYHSSLW